MCYRFFFFTLANVRYSYSCWHEHFHFSRKILANFLLHFMSDLPPTLVNRLSFVYSINFQIFLFLISRIISSLMSTLDGQLGFKLFQNCHQFPAHVLFVSVPSPISFFISFNIFGFFLPRVLSQKELRPEQRSIIIYYLDYFINLT